MGRTHDTKYHKGRRCNKVLARPLNIGHYFCYTDSLSYSFLITLPKNCNLSVSGERQTFCNFASVPHIMDLKRHNQDVTAV